MSNWAPLSAGQASNTNIQFDLNYHGCWVQPVYSATDNTTAAMNLYFDIVSVSINRLREALALVSQTQHNIRVLMTDTMLLSRYRI